MSPENPDLATVARDDLLLDALGRGEAGPADDPAAVLLAAWHADLLDDLPEPTIRPGAYPPPAPPVPLKSRRRLSTRLLLAAAAVVIFLAGLAIGAADAGPGSPLWPITQVFYADRADSLLAERDAEKAIAGARTAINERRYADAQRLLDQATALIARIHDEDVAQRLLAEVAALRALLPPGTGLLTAPPGVNGGPAPGVTATPGAPGGGQQGGGSQGGGGDPNPTTSSGGGLPLPTLPLPTLPLPTLPLPTLPLPTLPPLLGS